MPKLQNKKKDSGRMIGYARPVNEDSIVFASLMMKTADC